MVYMSVVRRVYMSPVNCSLPFSISRSTPPFSVVTVSHVSPSGSTAGAPVYCGWIPFRMRPDFVMLNSSLNVYAAMLPFPIEPYEPRNLRSEMNPLRTFQNGSADGRQPTATDGKKA